MEQTPHAKGPKGKLLSGSLQDFQKNPLKFMQDLAKEYREIAHFRFGPFQQVYFISDPNLIKEVLVKKQSHFVKSRDLSILKPIVGEGLLTSKKEHHLQQRRLIQPHFRQKHIIQYGEDMINTTNNYIRQWKTGEERDISEDMMNITLGIISKTMFSMELKEGHEIIGDSMDKIMTLAIKRMRALFPLPLWFPTKINREYTNAIKKLDEILYGIINKRRGGEESSDDLLGVLLKTRDETDGTGMSDKQLRDELMTIFLAGHETTANALAWTFYLLSENPQVEEKLYGELHSVWEVEN